MSTNDLIKVISYLTLLELSIDSKITEEQVKTAYRRLSKIYHPDLSNERYKDGKKFIQLQEAKDYLINNLSYVNRLIASNFSTGSSHTSSNYDYEAKQREEAARRAREEAARRQREAEERERKRREEERRRQEETKRRETERKKRIQEEKEKIQNELKRYTQGIKKDDYSDVNWNKLNNLINAYIHKLNTLDSYLFYKEDYELLLSSIRKIKTLKQEQQFNKNIKVGIVSFASLIFIIIMIMLTINVFIPSLKYSKAVNLIEKGRYEEAEQLLYELGDYKESEVYYIILFYVRRQCDSKKYYEAIYNLEILDGSSTFNIDYNGGIKSDVYLNFCGKRINSCEKAGYTFKEYVINGYTLDVKNKNLIIEVKATYTINQYSITYYLNGGSLTKNNPSGYSVDTDTFTLNEPIKTGYEFLGWTYSGNSTPAKNVKIAKGTTGNLTYTAKWKANSYLVRLDSDGGNIVNDLSVVYDSNYSLPTPTKAGYSFLGWYEGNNSVPSSGTWKYTTNLNLVARWSLKSYSITYYLNGGQVNNPSSYNINTSTFTLNNPVKTGYKFVGWSTSANGTKYMNVKIAKGSTGSKTYYANWEVITYNINYYLDSGTNNLNNPKTYTVEDSVQLKNSTKTGYSFEGWYSDSNFQTKVVTINKGTTGDLNLYAKFTVNTYKIAVNPSTFNVKFMMNDGTNSLYTTQLVSTTSGLKYPSIPTRSGYIFIGWYTDESCSEIYDFTKTIHIDTQLYAGWMQNSYTIKNVTNNFSISLDGKFVFTCLTSGEITFKLGDNFNSYYRSVTVTNLTKNKTIFSGEYKGTSLPATYTTIVDAGDVILVSSSSLYITADITMTISGITSPLDGGKAVDTSRSIAVKYDGSYNISVRKIEGYKFVGYFDANGKQYTDKYGNSLFKYNIEKDLTLYEKWEQV